MAGNPFLITPPSPLAALMAGVEGYDRGAKQLQEQQQREAYQQVGDLIASGRPVGPDVLGQLLREGPAAAALLPTVMGIQKQQQDNEASSQFSRGINKLYQGSDGQFYVNGDPDRPIPPTDRVKPDTVRAMMPGYNGEPARPKVAPTATTWGDDEAVAAGIYDRPPRSDAPPTTAPAQARPSTQPAPQAQQTMPMPSGGLSPRGMALIQAASNPRLPAPQREIAKSLLDAEMKASGLTDEMREYALDAAQRRALGQPVVPFGDWKANVRRAGATNISIDQKAESAFETAFAGPQAKRWNGYIEAGDVAQSRLSDINTMREISRRLGVQGAAAGIKETLGPYAEALGINVDGLSDIQVFSGIVQKMAPQMHVAGTGSQSDIEFKGLLKSLPGLMQNPQAREALMDTFEASARHDLARADIAVRLANKEISRGQAEKELRGLGDPLEAFKAWRRANPQAFGEALKAGAWSPPPAGGSPAAPPSQAAPVRVQSPAEARQLAPGTRFVTPDGREFTR